MEALDSAINLLIVVITEVQNSIIALTSITALLRLVTMGTASSMYFEDIQQRKERLRIRAERCFLVAKETDSY